MISSRTIDTSAALDVYALAFSRDGRVLVSGGTDGLVNIWDLTSGRELRSLGGHSGMVNAVLFSPDGQTLASASDDNTVKLWDASSIGLCDFERS